MTSNAPSATPARPLSLQWLGPVVIVSAFVLAALLSWRKWPNPLIDFGLQLYLPWKISTGSVLYRDISYLTGGPLSQYLNGIVFSLSGVSLTSLIIANLLLTALLVLAIYRSFLAASDTLTATTISLAVVLAFAFAQYDDIGNYNFITPYCHELFHGLVLSVVAIGFLSAWLAKQRLPFAAAAGLCFGLVFLTKPEIFLALALCAATAFSLAWLTTKRPKFLLQSLAAFLGASLLPFLGFLLYFHRFEDWSASFRSVVFAWVPLLQSSVTQGFYYRWCLGLDNPGFHIKWMLTHFTAVVFLVVLYAALFHKKPASRIVPLLFIAPLLALASRFDWTNCGRSLPLLSLVSCFLLALGWRRLGLEKPPVFPLLWAVFAFALLAKLGLFCRIWHYGFVLAMPAFVSAIYLLLWLLPNYLEARYGIQRQLFRATVWLTLIVGLGFLFAQSILHYQRRTFSVGQGGDRIVALDPKINPTAPAFQAALAWLQTNTPADATLAVLPEGVMLNYLSRRANPARYFVWNPAETEFFSQAAMTDAFERYGPDYVMLIDRDAKEYGVKPFGQEDRFGGELLRWLRQHYEPVWVLGNEPLQDAGFGIKLLKKLPPAASPKTNQS